MPASRLVAVVLGSALIGQSPNASRLGGSLSPGMQLLYESNGVTTPWFIDSVNTSFAAGGRPDCLRFVLRIGAAQPQVRTHCVVADTMMTLSQTSGRLLPARRLSAGVLTIPAANRGFTRFEVRSAEHVAVGDQHLLVWPTVVTGFDSTGKAVRQLTERFSPALATAIDGTFAVPDSTSADVWRVTQQFRLTGIRRQ